MNGSPIYDPVPQTLPSPLEDLPPAFYRLVRSTQPCPLSELPALHQRVLRADVGAFDAITRMLLPELRRRLRVSRWYAMPEWIEDAIVDALMEYRDRPGKYVPTRGLSLVAYLAYAAKRDLLNYQTAHRRHVRHETTEVAPGFWDALAAPEPPDGGSRNLPWVRRMLRATTADLTPEERTVFRLQMEDEHQTSAYAQALHLTHLPQEVQVRHVRRLTARVSQRVRRRLLRLRRERPDAPEPLRHDRPAASCKTPPVRAE